MAATKVVRIVTGTDWPLSKRKSTGAILYIKREQGIQKI